MTQVNVMCEDWTRFYAATSDDPRETLLAALRLAGPGDGRFAVDLGCGTGRDTAELLRQGWRVLAIDAEPAGIARLLTRAQASTRNTRSRLETQIASFEQAAWPRADLVNCSFSLPFCPPVHFAAVWARIVASLRPGGLFAGQLFGDRDEWAPDGLVTLTRAQAESLFLGFTLERFEEVEEDGQTAFGTPKHWHVYHVVARKARP